MREKILFNDNWFFHKGDVEYETPKSKGPVYKQTKTEQVRQGPGARAYSIDPNDFRENIVYHSEKWERVNLPHDYIIDQVPDKDENEGLGYFKYDNAWYRKDIEFSSEDKDKRITLYFEGVATHATVIVNGIIAKRNFCGYTSFEVDITDFIEFDEKNSIAVYVDAKKYEGWWYNGGGIYRNVYIIKTNKVCVDLYGLYGAPKKIGDTTWVVDFETTVRNDNNEEKEVTVENELDGKKVKSKVKINPFDKIVVKQKIEIENPALWDINSPNLYEIKANIYYGDALIDQVKENIGFRTIKLDPNEGFFINGRYEKIKGVCSHQDFGLTGKAVPDNIYRHRVRLIKEMGANGYRCSHYPHAEATMDELDKQGFIVMDEARWFSTSEDAIEQLELLVKRDRNHPSVVFWSLGNEEPHHIKDSGRRICERMAETVRKLDNTRCIMTAVSNNPDEGTIYGCLDAIGVNYNLYIYDRIRELYPDKPIFASECVATGSTRGWYFENCDEKKFINAFDHATNAWYSSREITWKFMMERKWVLGAYQWIAYEHRGETMWPRLCSQSGAIDLFMQKKDAFYQNQSHWIEDKPIVHIAPHWNWQGMEGKEIPTIVYTNCEEIEIFVNGKSLGREKMEKFTAFNKNVVYEKGELKVVAYNGGKKVAEDIKITSGYAKKLKLKFENEFEANGQDIALITCWCEDENGHEVPNATPFVSFACNELGTIVGTGSSVIDHIPVPSTERKMYAGRISVAVRLKTEKGKLKVYAESENLDMAYLEIEV